MTGMTEEHGIQDVIDIKTSRFGEIQVQKDEVITILGGLLGFVGLERYVLINNPQQAPFMWFQCLDEGELAFVVIDPFMFFPGYKVQAKQGDLEPLGVKSIEKTTVLTIVTIPMDPKDITANLRGPLLFNVEKKLGKQLVLLDDRYHTKHYLLRDIPQELAGGSTSPSKTKNW